MSNPNSQPPLWATCEAQLALFFIDAHSLSADPAATASFTLCSDDGPAASAESRLSVGDQPAADRAQSHWAPAACALQAGSAQRHADGAHVAAKAQVLPEGDLFRVKAEAHAAPAPDTSRASSAQAQATPSPLGLRVVLSARSVLTVHARASVRASAPAPARRCDQRAHAVAELYIACDRDGTVLRSQVARAQAQASSGGTWTEQGWTGPNAQADDAVTLEASLANPGDEALTMWIVAGVSAEASAAACVAPRATADPAGPAVEAAVRQAAWA
ncbi:MAG: hypothetical protein RJA10_108 [Pseudomonadota bacterium]|jgi:hypothetical protein